MSEYYRTFEAGPDPFGATWKAEFRWSQNGIYVSFAMDPSQPDTWKKPTKVLDQEDIPSWSTFYPQVMGLEAGGTDTLAGQRARFYLNGLSRWEIEFVAPAPPQEPEEEP